MSNHKRRHAPVQVSRLPLYGVPRWYTLSPRGMACGPFATERGARAEARQEANRSGYQRCHEAAIARQKAQETEQQVRVIGAFGGHWPRGQTSGPIHGQLLRGRQRTKAGKARR